MTRYIDADRFERVLLSMGEDNICNECCMAVIEKLDAQPTADVRENVKGRWTWHNYYYNWVCSNCLQLCDERKNEDDVWAKPTYEFCPCCGAQMEQGK